ncbi:MAG: hypothetical protein QM706_18075 [Nitrospira sp.]
MSTAFSRRSTKEHTGACPVPPETRDGMGDMFADPNQYGVDGRAVMYHMAYFSPKVFGAGQFYLLNISDKSGQPLRRQQNLSS